MDITILSPVDRESRKGNGVTTRRWERVLSALGHSVHTSVNTVEGIEPDVLVTLHAGRSAGAIRRFSNDRPDVPIVLALTGTDVYRDIHEDDRAQESLDIADRLIVLQKKALDELTASQRRKARVIHQSIQSVPWSPDPPEQLNSDDVHLAVLAHLRSEKDPFRTAAAVRRLPESSSISVWHLGEELEEGYRDKAKSRSRELDRYQWLGGYPRRAARLFLSHSDLMVISSRLEGGAHVVSEAIACETPVLASDIPGNTGLLGDDYEGYFEVGNENELAELMVRAEEDADFYNRLQNQIKDRKHVSDPTLEYERWEQLIEGTRSTAV